MIARLPRLKRLLAQALFVEIYKLSCTYLQSSGCKRTVELPIKENLTQLQDVVGWLGKINGVVSASAPVDGLKIFVNKKAFRYFSLSYIKNIAL